MDPSDSPPHTPAPTSRKGVKLLAWIALLCAADRHRTKSTWFWPALLGGILLAAGGGALAVQKIRKGGGTVSLGEKGALAAVPHTAV
ncbi:MAG: hypothetical protein WDW36_009472 [Sanguina aurantia]